MFLTIQARAEEMKIPDSLLSPGFLAMSLHLLTPLKTLSSSAMHTLVDALGQECTGTPSIAAPPSLHVSPTPLCCCVDPVPVNSRDARKRGPFDCSLFGPQSWYKDWKAVLPHHAP